MSRLRFSGHQRVQRDGAVVVQRVALAVDLLGVGGDHLAGHLADDLQNAAIVVDRVGRVARGVAGRIVVRVGEIVLLQPGQLGQVDMIEQELDVVVIEKEIRHGETPRGLLRNRRRFLYPLSTIHYSLPTADCPLSRHLLDRLNHHRNHLLVVADDAVMGDAEDRGVAIGVDGDDLGRLFHARPMLHRAADADAM